MPTTNLLNYATLIDVVQEYTSTDATAQYLWAAQVLNRKCPLIQMMPMVPSNQILSNIGSRDTVIGTAQTRSFNYGVPVTVTKSAPFVDPIALFEDYSEVDKSLWEIQNDPNAWRQNQDRRKVEGLVQGVENMLIYGNINTSPGGFNGLATRFYSLTYRPNGDTSWPYNVLSGSGTGSDLTSVYALELGPDKVFCTFPRNTAGGLRIRDLGEDTKVDAAGGLYQVLRTHFQWYVGLAIADERCVQRYCNIESTGTTNIFSFDTLLAAIGRLPERGSDPGTVIVCNRTIKTQLDIAAMNKANNMLTIDSTGSFFGQHVTRFMGIPILVCDKILDTESTVS